MRRVSSWRSVLPRRTTHFGADSAVRSWRLEPAAICPAECFGGGHHHLPQGETPAVAAFALQRTQGARGRQGEDVLVVRSAASACRPVAATAQGAAAGGGTGESVASAELVAAF